MDSSYCCVYAQRNCRRYELESKVLFDEGGTGIISGSEILLVKDVLLLANLTSLVPHRATFLLVS